MAQKDLLNPEATKKGTRRINKLPIIIVIAVACSFALILLIAVNDSSKRQNRIANIEPQQTETSGRVNSFADELVARKGQLPPPLPVPESELAVPENAPPLPETIPLTSPADREIPPPPISLPTEPVISQEEMRRRQMIEDLKFDQMQKAIGGGTSISYSSPTSSFGSSSSSYNGDPQSILNRIGAARAALDNAPSAAEQYQQLYQQASSIVGGMGGGGFAGGGDTPPPSANYTPDTSDRWNSHAGDPEPPSSPFELRTGAVIPSTLISGINSDLPGQILGQVAQNVYDTATGRHLLIPQGARLIGNYQSDVAFGQTRVVAVWNRVIFPDGKVLDIGEQPGTDMSGYSGYEDRVNTHFLRTIASAMLMSGIIAGVELSQNTDTTDDNTNSRRAGDALSEALGQTLGQALGQMIQKNMNVAPTVEIRPGYRFNVMVVKDFVFSKPYESFDY